MRRITVFLAGLIMLAVWAGPVTANEFTDVIDAFDRDNGDPFDLNISIGYERYSKSGVIRRESYAATPHEWDYYAYLSMAKYSQVTHILNMELDIGLFKDISLRTRVPLILSDTRELKKKGTGWLSGEDNLFSVPFKSAERSGLDYLAVGLWWGILAQDRDDTKPNWTIYAEGRFGVGDELKAACHTTGTELCSQSGYNTKGGISRGLNELAIGTRLSRRYGIMDPYFGFEALMGWSKGGAIFTIDDNSAGQINDQPPIIGSIDFGIELVPWDIPSEFRKFVIGIGARASYHSEGREATPLFDALGTSDYFNNQEYVDFNGNDENDGGEEEVALRSWTGMTDVENYATFLGRIYFMIQPAKYVKFRVGMDLGHETEHFITKTDQCPADKVQAGGTCIIYNWGHRPELDRPGSRFRAEETLLFSLFIDATAQF